MTLRQRSKNVLSIDTEAKAYYDLSLMGMKMSSTAEVTGEY